MQEVRKYNWSDLMVKIKPSHKAFWGLAKALKTEGAVPTPTLRKFDNSIVFDDREKAVFSSIEQQCSENPQFDVEYVRWVKEEVRRRVSLPPKYDLDLITQDELTHHGTSGTLYYTGTLEVATIFKFMKDASERFFNIASSHPNPLLVSAVSYEPPPPHYFCRRPRNVLIDPPDDFTDEVEKLINVIKMAID
ncbi:hypothetical protein EVAR_14013_1 [Eumeta japonica]|uniref:Uncharacterized protein n=1 Tax=Eumeta variegata TaxID=151549 RepID=A0A4C1X8W8_EUMVA|nr:hypothetical protein EVAR_14013_1 [Eumeta japonica]